MDHRLSRLEAIAAMGETSALYCRGYDQRDLELFVTQWTPDGVFRIGKRQQFGGRDEIRRAVLEQMWPSMQHTFHLLDNFAVDGVDVEKGKAAAHCTGLAIVTYPDNSRELAMAMYTDEFVRTGTAWNFAERGARISQRVGLPATVPIDQSKAASGGSKTEVEEADAVKSVEDSNALGRLGRLEDRQEIQTTLYNYCHGFDRRDISLFLDQFEPAAIFGVDGKEWPGHDVIRKIVEQKTWPKLKSSTHLTGNVVITFVESERAPGQSEAHVTSDSLTLLVKDTGETHLVTAVYEDRLSKGTGRWRFVQRLARGTGLVVLRGADE